MKMLRDKLRFIIFTLFVLMNYENKPAHANKLDWSTGFYNLVAKTPTASGKVNSFSYYQISLRSPLTHSLELGLGYSLSFSRFFTGDMAYGPDMGLFYFPFSKAVRTNLVTDATYFYQEELWRPFISGNFHQRQYQSVQASYAGFSGGIGTEYWGFSPIGIRAWSQYIMLKGPTSSFANEFDLLLGLTWEY